MKNITATEFEELFEYQNGSRLLLSSNHKLVLDDGKCFWLPNNVNDIPDLSFDLSFFENKSFQRILDIGSGFGFACSKLAEKAKIIDCWEPSSNAFDILDSNLDIAVNTYARHTTFNRHNVAITNTTLWATELAEDQHNLLNSHMKLNEELYKDQTFEFILIKQQTIDSYKFNDVDLINIDVNGYDYYVLAGAKETLKNNKPFICINLNEKLLDQYRYTIKEIQEFLKSLDYVEISNNIYSSKQ